MGVSTLKPPTSGRRPRQSTRAGFTIADVLVVIGIVGMLVSLTVPAVQRAREQSRAASCQNNIRQLAIAAQSHEAAFHSFPYTSTTWWDSGDRRYNPVSPHRFLIRWLDPAAGNKVDLTDPADPVWSVNSPVHLSPGHIELLRERIPVFACPSDDVPAGATSYRANAGISVEVLPPSATVEAISQKGAFVNGRSVRPSEFHDGLSNTALFSERVVGDYNSSRYNPFRDIFGHGVQVRPTAAFVNYSRSVASPTPASEYSFAGGSWLLGGWLNTWYNHILPPNSEMPDAGIGPSCTDGGQVLITPRSLHSGGVHVAIADASVRFVSTVVDQAVWTALGTRAGGETEALP